MEKKETISKEEVLFNNCDSFQYYNKHIQEQIFNAMEEYAAQHPHPSSINNARAIGLLQGVVKGIDTMGSDVNLEGVVKSLKEAVGLIETSQQSESVEFAEWVSNNQFTCYNEIWTSTKIHYMPDKYKTSELYQLFLHNKKK